MLNSKKEDFLNFLKGKNLLITTHDSVDLDGFISGIVLKYCFEQLFSNQSVFLTFSGLSKHTKSFVNKFSTKFPNFKFTYQDYVGLSDIEVIVIVDTNNLDQVKIFNEISLGIPIVFIDHHYNPINKIETEKSKLHMIFENFSSTSEIILEIFRDCNFQYPKPYRILLASAILMDSGFLRYGNNKTIENLLVMLQDQLELQEILPLLEKKDEISNKIARIKGIQRVKLLRVNDYLIGVTYVSSFSASVASTLIIVGFDVSIVVSAEKDSFRITTRAKREICLSTGLNLGSIMSGIKSTNGGGHEGAASLNGGVDLKNCLNEVLERIKRTLKNELTL